MYCSKCGNQIEEGGSFCRYCGAPIEKQEVYAPHDRSAYNYQEQPQYQQQAYQTQYQQQYQRQNQQEFVQQAYEAHQRSIYENITAGQDISKSRTLGTFSIIFALLGFHFLAWILGGIGLSKANRYIYSRDLLIGSSARSAKKMNKAGLIISIVLFMIGVIGGILLALYSYGFLSYY